MTVELDGMIRAYRVAANDKERARLNGVILGRYNVTAALLVLDMTGFSRITAERGIVSFLAMVQHMQDITAAEISVHGGRVIKFFSDNCFAYFDNAQDAVECAAAVIRAHHEINKLLEQPVQICIGIDYGEFLLIKSGECFGHAVNRACKLGEDIARSEELLITETTRAAMESPERFAMEPRVFEESGLVIDAYTVDAWSVSED